MKQSAKYAFLRRSSTNGFSLVELVLSLAFLLVITTLAVPIVVRSLQTYQLNSTASQLAGLLKFAKFDAIRQNTPVSVQIVQQGADWLVWVDSNGNLRADGAEPRMVITGGNTLLPGGSAPTPAAILTNLGTTASSYNWTVLSGSNGSITYDQRGVLTYSGNGTINVLYLGNPNDPNTGFRAVITLPSGSVQVWTADSSGNWQRVS